MPPEYVAAGSSARGASPTVEHLGGRARAARPARAAQPREEHGVLARGERRVYRDVLRHAADRAAYGPRCTSEVVARDTDLARVRREQRREHGERRRLAGAVGPEQADDLAGRNFERELVEHSPPATVNDEPVDRNGGGGGHAASIAPLP